MIKYYKFQETGYTTDLAVKHYSVPGTIPGIPGEWNGTEAVLHHCSVTTAWGYQAADYNTHGNRKYSPCQQSSH
jgi:hypothetical protein